MNSNFRSLSVNCCYHFSILVGRRYKYNDPVFQGLIKSLNTYSANISITSIGNAFPKLYYTPIYKDFYHATQRITSLVKTFAGDRQSKSQKDPEAHDMVEFIQLEMERRKKRGLTGYMVEKGREWRVILDLFVAGITTTSDTLYWSLLLMAKHPYILKEVGTGFICSDEERRGWG